MWQKILSFDNLSLAWDEVAENGAGPGADGVTLADFARQWEANLHALRDAVQRRQYQPGPINYFTIPKRDGSPRLLTSLTVRDKILQRAVLRGLEPLCERLFLDCSYGYRPNRSIHQVVEQIVLERDLGRLWVLDADIDDFFHVINHDLLLGFVEQTLAEPRLVSLIKQWLKAHPSRPRQVTGQGTAMGAVISPLLANLYLHQLDIVMARQPQWTYLRYADDFIVMTRSGPELMRAYQQVAETLAQLKLEFEPSKTRLTHFDEGFTYLGCHFQGDSFYFEHEQTQYRVREDEDWPVFYDLGPQGYGEV